MTGISIDETAGEVVINGQSYRLFRNPSQVLPYKQSVVAEPPFDQTTPALISAPQDSWHWGAFKSLEGVDNTSESGQNTDTRWAYRIVPSQAIHTISLDLGATLPVQNMWVGLGYLWLSQGTKLFRVDLSTLTVTLSKDFTPDTPVSGVVWESQTVLVTTSAANNSLWGVGIAGFVIGGPDVWVQTVANLKPFKLAVGINRLFAISGAGILQNVSTGLSALGANWADSVQVGKAEYAPRSLIAYERSVITGTSEGYFSVGEEGFGVPIIKRIVPGFLNGLNPCNYDPWLMLPHVRGLYRWQPGLAQACGLEVEVLNSAGPRGSISAVVAEGDWLYALLDTGSVTYILAGRERRQGEQGFSPIIWDTNLYFTQSAQAHGGVGTLCLTTDLTTGTSARLWFSYGLAVGYINLTDGFPGAGLLDPAATFSRTTHRYRFNTYGTKNFQYFKIATKNLDLNNSWTISYSVDGGAFSSLDASGFTMLINVDGLSTFYLPSSATGREIQFRFDGISNAAKFPEISYFEPFASPVPQQFPVITCQLLLAAQQHGLYRIDSRDASDQWDDLNSLVAQKTPVTVSGPWGDNKTASVNRLTRLTDVQEGVSEQASLVEVELLLRVAIT